MRPTNIIEVHEATVMDGEMDGMEMETEMRNETLSPLDRFHHDVITENFMILFIDCGVICLTTG